MYVLGTPEVGHSENTTRRVPLSIIPKWDWSRGFIIVRRGRKAIGALCVNFPDFGMAQYLRRLGGPELEY